MSVCQSISLTVLKTYTGKLHTVLQKCKDICSFQSTVSWYLLWRTILVNLCCSTITDQTVSFTKFIFCYFFQKTEHIIILNVNRKSITIKIVFVSILPLEFLVFRFKSTHILSVLILIRSLSSNLFTYTHKIDNGMINTTIVQSISLK